MNLFHNRSLVIATMHQKEAVIAPLLEKSFSLNCLVPTHLNTDLLGTFSGEKERKDSPLVTARIKCELAMDELGCDLAIASEGSFGPHPFSFLSCANEELVLLVDRKNGIEIYGSALSTETNFDGTYADSISAALAFAKKVKFPTHALILKDKKEEATRIHKGIVNVSVLEELFELILSTTGKVWIETDMRAMYNPTRQTIIEKATQELVLKMKSLCPSCNHPGYWVVKGISGLPCDLCNRPTQSTLAHVYGCLKCDHKEQKLFPNHKTVEDPTFCDSCNP